MKTWMTCLLILFISGCNEQVEPVNPDIQFQQIGGNVFAKVITGSTESEWKLVPKISTVVHDSTYQIIETRDTLYTIIETIFYDSTHQIIETHDTTHQIIITPAEDDFIMLTEDAPLTLTWNRVHLDTNCNEETHVIYRPSATIIIPNWEYPAIDDTSFTFRARWFEDGTYLLLRVVAIDEAGNVSKESQYNKIIRVEKQ